MKAVVAAFNQEKALVGAFSVIANLRMELFEALVSTLCTIAKTLHWSSCCPPSHSAARVTASGGHQSRGGVVTLATNCDTAAVDTVDISTAGVMISFRQLADGYMSILSIVQ